MPRLTIFDNLMLYMREAYEAEDEAILFLALEVSSEISIVAEARPHTEHPASTT